MATMDFLKNIRGISPNTAANEFSSMPQSDVRTMATLSPECLTAVLQSCGKKLLEVSPAIPGMLWSISGTYSVGRVVYNYIIIIIITNLQMRWLVDSVQALVDWNYSGSDSYKVKSRSLDMVVLHLAVEVVHGDDIPGTCFPACKAVLHCRSQFSFASSSRIVAIPSFTSRTPRSTEPTES